MVDIHYLILHVKSTMKEVSGTHIKRLSTQNNVNMGNVDSLVHFTHTAITKNAQIEHVRRT